MPQLSGAVSDLQETVDIATMGGPIHTNHVLNIAKKAVTYGHCLRCLRLDSKLYVNRSYTETSKNRKVVVGTS